MEEINALLDLFSKVGLPAGLLLIALYAIRKVCLWLKPWIERLMDQHSKFLDAATASQASSEEHFREVHQANAVTHEKLDDLLRRVEKKIPASGRTSARGHETPEAEVLHGFARAHKARTPAASGVSCVPTLTAGWAGSFRKQRMATRQEITDAVDAGIAAAWPAIEAAQTAYFTTRGRYFQGLCTHSTFPADGNPQAADRLDTHPPNQAETWLDVGYGDVSPHAALIIDQYAGPEGAGYLCTFALTIAGDLWTRRINVGYDALSASAWQIEPLPQKKS